MRRSGPLAAWFLAAMSALATGVTGPEPLTYRGVTGTRDGGRIRASFDAPDDADAQDLRGNPVSIRVGTDEPVVFGDEVTPLRVTKNGAVARFRAGRRDPSRVRKFKLSPVQGTFVVSLGGGRLDPGAPPAIELSFAGRVYRWPHPATDYPAPVVVPPPKPEPSDPTPPAPQPDGPIESSTVYHGTVISSQAVTNGVIRTSSELTSFLGSVTFAAGTPAGIENIDLSAYTIVVVANYSVVEGISPWRVELRSVTRTAGRVGVAYDRYWGPFRGIPEAGEAPNPPLWTKVQIATIPATSEPVDFTDTGVHSNYPW